MYSAFRSVDHPSRHATESDLSPVLTEAVTYVCSASTTRSLISKSVALVMAEMAGVNDSQSRAVDFVTRVAIYATPWSAANLKIVELAIPLLLHPIRDIRG